MNPNESARSLTLSEFLLARYDQAEADHRRWAAGCPVGQHQEWCRGGGLWMGTCDECGCAAVPGEISPEVLADLEGKRQIVRLFEAQYPVDSEQLLRTHGKVFRALALPFVDHPDFRAEWRT